VWAPLAPLPLLALSIDGTISRLDGAILLAWFVVALFGMARAGRDLPAGEPPERKRFALLRMVTGLVLLTAVGDVLGRGISDVVRRFHVSDALLGNTAIAAVVEAEEVGRVAVPAKRGRGELAFANIAGTLVHFAAFNAGLIALIHPLRLSAATVHLHLPVAAASAIVLALVLAVRGSIRRAEGAVMLLLYVAYVAAAIALR
jgi:cation:H+ antiporter